MSNAKQTDAPRRAVVLLSGGLDSSTCLAVARDRGFDTHALTVDYGQLQAVELDAARRVAEALGASEHLELPFDLTRIGGSALTGDLAVPKDRGPGEIGDGIPVTYVPARNTILLSVALAWAEVRGARDLFLGVNAVDYSGYPDCRPEFIEAFERLANVATKAGVEAAEGVDGAQPIRIHAPLLKLDKTEIIMLGQELGVDYGLTWTCYDPQPGPLACGRCDACLLRREAFTKIGQSDPVAYYTGRDDSGTHPAAE